MRWMLALLLSGCSMVYGMADANLVSVIHDETKCDDIRIVSKIDLSVYNVKVCGENRQYIYVARDGEFVRVDR